MTTHSEKDINTRLRETAKIEAETKRSLAVVEEKKAHKAIEDLEIDRKRPSVASVCKRLQIHAEDVKLFLDLIRSMEKVYSQAELAEVAKEALHRINLPDNEAFTKLANNVATRVAKDAELRAIELWIPHGSHVLEMYEAICYDYKEALGLNEDTFQKLFPRIEVSLNDSKRVVVDLLNLYEQELHMIVYCYRFLPQRE